MSRINKKNVIALIAYSLMKDIDDSSDISDDKLYRINKMKNIELIIKEKLRTRVPRIRCKNYVENVVPLLSDMEFKTLFR